MDLNVIEIFEDKKNIIYLKLVFIFYETNIKFK